MREINVKGVVQIAGEFLIGTFIGYGVATGIMPKCNSFEKALVFLGTIPVSWTVGRIFDKEIDRLCDPNIDDSIHLFKD